VPKLWSNYRRLIRPGIVSDIVKKKENGPVWVESGKTLNMTSVEDGPNFLYWVRNWDLDAVSRSYGF